MAKKNINKPITDASEATLDKVVGASKSASTEGIPSADGTARDTTTTASSIKDEVAPKNVFNTKKVAELVSDGGTNANASTASLLSARVVTFSGGADQVQGDGSASVRGVAPRKSGDRPGRTIDTALKHIDDVPAESFRVPLNTIPQLRDGNSNVGYNGNYTNAHAVSQKGSGGSPASNKFFRTLDVVEYDNLYFAEGQNNEAGILTVRSYVDANYDETHPDQFSVGNFLTRSMDVTFDNNGNLIDIDFDVVNLDDYRDRVTEDVYRLAGDNFLRQNNIMELDRLNMIKTAGDESKDNWSPLGEVILDSSAANRMMKELDAMNGDIQYLSASKLSTALAYQINKSAKDGLRRVSPMFEALCGNVDKWLNVRHTSSVDTDATHLFSDAYGLSRGSSALYIAMEDSTAKYNTKGKMLSLPLSFKTALDTSAKNRGAFMMHQNLFDEFNKQEVFGKIDEDGSGISPCFLSDGAGLIFPININDTYTAITEGKVDNMFILHYEDLRNKYNFPVYNFFVQGLVDYFTRKGGSIVKLLLNRQGNHYSANDLHITKDQLLEMYPDDNTIRLHIPVTSTTSCISLWDIIVCAAAKDIAIRRQYAMNLVLKYESLNNSYPYSGLIRLDSVAIGGSANVGFTDINTGLSQRNIPLTTGVRLLMPEVFSPKTCETQDNALFGGRVHISRVILPWYFNQGAFTSQSNGTNTFWALNAGDGSHMTYFDSRGGVSFANMDRIMQLDPEQLKFAMDRLVDIPGRGALVTAEGYDALTYKYSASDDGIPVSSYYAYAISDNQKDKVFTIGRLLACPRELGLSFVAPAGVVTPAYDAVNNYSNYRDLNSSYLGTSGPSFRIKYWHSAACVSNTLFEDNLDTAIAINLEAVYDTIEATAMRGVTDIGIAVSANHGVDNITTEIIHPFMLTIGNAEYNYEHAQYNDGQVANNAIQMVSALKYLYARIQMLPFIINPFDANTYIYGTQDVGLTYINRYDDFDFLHLYNVCGFRDGEYSGTEYDRNRARIEMGLGYVSDPYIERRL